MEPDYGDPNGRIRLLENQEYFERYVAIIRNHNAKVTMFTVTSLFERFGEQFAKLGKRIPLEYAAHSHNHNPNNGATIDEVASSARVIKRVQGNSPLGYRAPYGQITKEGLGHLLDLGYQYDSSVYPSYRPGKFGYANLHLPNDPFRITRENKSLIELPFTSLTGVRIVLGLSYVKLLGWGIYSLLWRIFGLPKIALALSHPHDFYFHELAGFHPVSAEKLALSRNAKRAFDYFDNVVTKLGNQGYEFAFVSEAFEHVGSKPDLQDFALKDWK
jgi:peptidoglycan/xylan/chitin deacetylase (PgdA/CDA1 family)